MAICFRCDDVAVFRAGRRVGRLTDVSRGRPALLAAVRVALPDDRALAELPARR